MSPSCCKSGEDLEHPLAPASYTPRPDLLGLTCGELSPRKYPLKYWRQQWWKMQCRIRRPQRSVQRQITASWSHCTGIAVSQYPTWLLSQNNQSTTQNSYRKDGSIDDFERKHPLTRYTCSEYTSNYHDTIICKCCNALPSRELTHPTLEKGKSSSKVTFGWDMSVPRRVDCILCGDTCILHQNYCLCSILRFVVVHYKIPSN